MFLLRVGNSRPRASSAVSLRIGTKILLLMLLITIGACAIVSWIVTLNVTRYETERANDQILLAIGNYVRHLSERHTQIIHIVQALLEAPAQRSLLQAADDSTDSSSREQLRQEVFGRDVQTELQSLDGEPQFHVLLNQASDAPLLTASRDAALQQFLSSPNIKWPVDAVLAEGANPVIQYVATPSGLFLAMGVPLHAQLNQAPTHAYFVGFRVDDNWVRQQLLADRVSDDVKATSLDAWFVVDDKIVARASSNPGDTFLDAFSPSTPLRLGQQLTASSGAKSQAAEFQSQGQNFLGRIRELAPVGAQSGRMVLASSLTEALLPLSRLQWEIAAIVAAACLVVLVLCRWLALTISRPIEALVAGTWRISTGQFDTPVNVHRRDELGVLADSFNQMALGLKERDQLREERVKIEHDLALARKIQMDVLPKELPTCPGYDIAAFSHPAEQTGGDIYDLVAMALDPTRSGDSPSLVLLLADATGHGIGPAISVTQVRSMLRMGVRLRADLDEVLSQINRQLCNDLGQQRFVTAFLGLLDPSANQINYRSAGQAPLLHFHGKNHRFEWLDSSMLPLGIDEDSRSEGERHMQIEPGDLIVLLTDGFYEFHNPQGEMFGRDRVAEVILKHHHRPARELLEEILTSTREFAAGAPQDDDMTAVIIRRLPPE
jgi:serine phosphatase RsbU (regulator of sigma subunit)